MKTNHIYICMRTSGSVYACTYICISMPFVPVEKMILSFVSGYCLGAKESIILVRWLADVCLQEAKRTGAHHDELQLGFSLLWRLCEPSLERLARTCWHGSWRSWKGSTAFITTASMDPSLHQHTVRVSTTLDFLLKTCEHFFVA